MILGIYTAVHVLISLIAIFTGFVVLYGLLNARQSEGLTKWFLWTTVLTSVTGFFFPFKGFTPAYTLGGISLVVLAVALFALYRKRLAGGWRTTYVISSMMALYLNSFVLVVQLFKNVPVLKSLAPTQSEGPFKIAQLVVLVFFVVVTILATTRFRRAQLQTA
jgi:hypothetical protein